jgi:hypothetical protein
MPKKKKKNPEGRPTKFESVDKIQFKKLVEDGWDDKKISGFFGINLSTLTRWKQKNEAFCTALKDWKKEADKKVELSLFKRALGYEYDEITYEKSKIGGLGIKLKDKQIQAIKHCDTYKTKVVTKQVVPDVLACIFWLKNRQPQDWREKSETDAKDKESFALTIYNLINGNGSGKPGNGKRIEKHEFVHRAGNLKIIG